MKKIAAAAFLALSLTACAQTSTSSSASEGFSPPDQPTVMSNLNKYWNSLSPTTLEEICWWHNGMVASGREETQKFRNEVASSYPEWGNLLGLEEVHTFMRGKCRAYPSPWDSLR
ncbi:MAG: hypothetical protein Q8M73_09515 [Actinomycetota bacterium]|nr:hypothetical protein [Actinomycetota bacterium]